jgi:hypothetical protein
VIDYTFILAFLFNELYFTGGMRRAIGEIRLHDKVDLHVAKNTSIGKRIEPILSTKMIIVNEREIVCVCEREKHIMVIETLTHSNNTMERKNS